MTPQEVSILDLLAERDRTTAAKLDAIHDQQAEMRADLRNVIDQLVGVATGAEVASLKRQVNAEIDVLSTRMSAIEADVGTVKGQLGERAAVERWKARAWGAAGIVVGLVIALAGVIVSAL